MDVAEVRAIARGVRISPRKVRLVVNVIKGRPVDEAVAMLRFMPQRACEPVRKVIQSAAANAEMQYNGDPTRLYVSSLVADEGPMFKNRRVARSKGRMSRLLSRTTHITVHVAEAEGE